MLRIPDSRIDQFIAEDVPYIDLTSEVLGIGAERGEMEFFTREACVLAGVPVARRIAEKCGCEITSARADGDGLAAGETFFVVRGAAADLHAAWKVCLNTFDHLSAVATKTRMMVNAPHCEVLTTRKSMPGAKDLLTSAIMAGGAFPHRLGLSETVLVFENHMEFMGGFDAFVEQLPNIKSKCIEKKLFVEANAEQARTLARVSAGGEGVDGIQLDKVPVDELTSLVAELREIDPRLTLIAAGGINPENAAAYAATCVDGLATTAPFSAKPCDMSARMHAL